MSDRRSTDRPATLANRRLGGRIAFAVLNVAHRLGRETKCRLLRTDDRDAAEQAAAFLIGDRWDFSEHDS